MHITSDQRHENVPGPKDLCSPIHPWLQRLRWPKKSETQLYPGRDSLGGVIIQVAFEVALLRLTDVPFNPLVHALPIKNADFPVRNVTQPEDNALSRLYVPRMVRSQTSSVW